MMYFYAMIFTFRVKLNQSRTHFRPFEDPQNCSKYKRLDFFGKFQSISNKFFSVHIVVYYENIVFRTSMTRGYRYMYRIYSQSSLHVPSKNASRRKRM